MTVVRSRPRLVFKVPLEHHARPAVVALRDRERSLCIDPLCELSGGYAHAGPCKPCNCPEDEWGYQHAIDECPILHPELA